jgi:hypothetical protein
VSEDPTREDSTRGHSFDELARAVAEGSLTNYLKTLTIGYHRR